MCKGEVIMGDISEKITIEDVDQVWERFWKATDRAEQHIFVPLAIVTTRLKAQYEDLHKNWDEEHAKKFIDNVEHVIKQI